VAPTELIGPFPAGVDPERYDQLRRRVLWRMPSGLYLVGSRAGERRNLMTANWVTQLSLEPKSVGVSVERSALTHELIELGQSFTVALVPRAERALVRRFVKPAEHDPAAHTLAGFAYRDAPVSGAPVLALTLGYLDCTLTESLPLGSHTLFVGAVVDAGFAPDHAEDEEVLRMEDTRMNYGG
jgi:flavin reductase (DIM6/NTAB) family NADH-FMN oxidoreductase RutF